MVTEKKRVREGVGGRTWEQLGHEFNIYGSCRGHVHSTMEEKEMGCTSFSLPVEMCYVSL